MNFNDVDRDHREAEVKAVPTDHRLQHSGEGLLESWSLIQAQTLTAVITISQTYGWCILHLFRFQKKSWVSCCIFLWLIFYNLIHCFYNLKVTNYNF